MAPEACFWCGEDTLPLVTAEVYETDDVADLDSLPLVTRTVCATCKAANEALVETYNDLPEAVCCGTRNPAKVTQRGSFRSARGFEHVCTDCEGDAAERRGEAMAEERGMRL